MTAATLPRPTGTGHDASMLTETDLPRLLGAEPVPARALQGPPGTAASLLIAGEWVGATDGRTFAVEDPATGRAIARVADAGPADCRAALEAADAAAAGWAAHAPAGRARVLRRAASLLRGRGDDLAAVLTAEMGKPLRESAEEVLFAADYLDWFAEEALRLDGRVCTSPDGGARHVVTPAPIGPCLIVTPWNFPLAIPARGLAPALAAGCTVVLRPSSLTPLSAIALAAILVEAGLPAGVLNVVVSTIDDVTDDLVTDGRIRKLTFTGSEAVGRHLIALAAQRIVRVSAELGGCAPVLVLADADIDRAVADAASAKMRNGGAACTAANRFYVERGIYERFTRDLAARVAALRIGPGDRPGVGLGPMISARHVRRLGDLVGDALARGARLVLRGGPLPGDGHFFAPVVLSDVPADARVMREEIFGPIVAIAPVEDEAEALRLANDHPAGLAAYLFTSDLERAMRLGGAIRAGMVALNRGRVSCVAAPFGGVGHSGYGSSGGTEGIGEYLVTRYLTMAAGGGAL